MLNGLITAAYIVAAILFILSLAGLSKQETAKNGNRLWCNWDDHCIGCYHFNS